jgi:hypothetical protein
MGTAMDSYELSTFPISVQVNIGCKNAYIFLKETNKSGAGAYEKGLYFGLVIIFNTPLP